ncbi:MAG: hypothetical protein JSW50_13445 [Candidatus Latescibacterota bacterium]|nr:MAG: hypothetical protein JSW50_13445 [Candidatus Latescibacterota bacterium]
MMSIRSWLLLVLAAIVAVSCSQLPPSDKSPEEMASIRAEYLENNPNGKYTEYIMEGRVVKGMNTMEVLASWGLPNVRRNWTPDNAEYWTYYARDEHTKKVVSYDLVFENRVLNRWVVNSAEGYAAGSEAVSPSTRTVEETLRLGDAQAASDSGSKTKK